MAPGADGKGPHSRAGSVPEELCDHLLDVVAGSAEDDVISTLTTAC